MLNAIYATERGRKLKRGLIARTLGLGRGVKSVKWIVDVLANDGYLVEQKGRWRFRSGLLRRYWERHVL